MRLRRAAPLVLATLWASVVSPWPVTLEHPGTHSHAVALAWDHGQLHLVLRHHHEPHAPAHEAGEPRLRAPLGHDHHDHAIHSLGSSHALIPKRSSQIASPLVARQTWTAPAVAAFPQRPWMPSPPEQNHMLSLLRTTVLVV